MSRIFLILSCLLLIIFQGAESKEPELAEFICSDGNVMKLKQVCDGKPDCADGSDELKELCYHILCPASMFRCHYGACIPSELRCNGRFDCVDRTDENNCGKAQNSCDLTEYRCISEECVPATQICDGNMDCRDGSDESTTICEEYPCPVDSFHCKHGGCIHLDNRCNGVADCIDGSDETEILCNNLKCKDDVCTRGSNLTCSPITSQRIKASCSMLTGKNKGLVPCDKPIPINTIAKLECKPFYQPLQKFDVDTKMQMTCQPDGTWNNPSFKCEPECGKSENLANPLIVKGKITDHSKWPWHATMFILEEGQWKFWCGGTLVSELVVVTAAHCVWDTEANLLRIGLGKQYSNITINEPNSQVRDVKQVIIQPSYQDQLGNYGSDIAVLILNGTVEFNNFIRPICIDWELHDMTGHLIHNNIGSIVGMGVTENDTFSEKLREINLPVVNNENCLEHQARDFKKFVTYTSFCAGWRNGSGVCNGDSGGGLIFPRLNEPNRWVLQGIVSISPRRQGTSFCDPHSLTVFTKVGIYVKWLRAVLNTIHPERFTALPEGPALEKIE